MKLTKTQHRLLRQLQNSEYVLAIGSTEKKAALRLAEKNMVTAVELLENGTTYIKILKIKGERYEKNNRTSQHDGCG